MKPFFLLLVCSLLFSCVMYAPQENKDLSYNFSLVGRINDTGSCFPIACIKADNGYDVYYVTAYHVIRDIISIDTARINLFYYTANGLDEVSYYPIRSYEMFVVKTDKDLDLAVVMIKSDAPMDVLHLSYRGLHLGETVYAMGCSLGGPPILSKGVATGLYDKTSFMVSAEAAPGSSGGPVFDKDGNVVGFTVAVAAISIGFGQNIVPHMHIMKSSCVLMDWLSHDFSPNLLNPGH